jgi:hypothetical protein
MITFESIANHLLHHHKEGTLSDQVLEGSAILLEGLNITEGHNNNNNNKVANRIKGGSSIHTIKAKMERNITTLGEAL